MSQINKLKNRRFAAGLPALSLLTLALMACGDKAAPTAEVTGVSESAVSASADQSAKTQPVQSSKAALAALTNNTAANPASLQVTTPGYTSRFLRHSGGLAFTEVVDASSGDTLKKDASWKLVPGLADASCLSFQSVNFPGDYLRHRFSRVSKDASDGSDGFKADATWCAKPGLSGTGVSFESKNFPGSYLRHYNAEVWLAKKAGGPLPTDSANGFDQDTSWNLVPAWTGGGTVPPVTVPPVTVPPVTVPPVLPPPPTGTCEAWSAGKAYVKGNVVSAGGTTYSANYWTQGNEPSANSKANSGAPWSVATANCGDPIVPPINPPPVNPPPVDPTRPPVTSGGLYRPDGKLVMAYFGNWTRYAGFGSYTVDKLPAGKVDVINIGFAKIVGGKCASTDEGADLGYNKPNIGGNFAEVKKWKAANPGGRAMIALGGWSWYGTNTNPNQAFTQMASTDAGRKAFVASCIEMFVKGDYPGFNSIAGVFDGIDIDWEYPGFSGGDSPDYNPAASQGDQIRRDYISLLQEFRAQMDAYKPGILLTSAVSADPQKIGMLDTQAMDKVLNWMNVMAYDFHGAFDPVTNFNAPLDQVTGNPAASAKFTVNEALKAYTDKGVPASHMLPGLAFYGRGWSNVQAGPNGDGLFQPASGAGALGGEQAGTAGYWKLIDIFKNPGWVLKYSEQAQSPYAYNAGTKEFWSYDDERSIAAKADSFKARGFGGAMYWMANQDSNNVLLNKLSSSIHR